MSTVFEPVVANQVIDPDHVNRYIDPINHLEEFREGTLASLGDQDLGNHGLKNLALGSAAAPALTFQADADTGIYSPAANSLAIATSGTLRASFDATGATLSGFKMATGAASGKILTSDANGVGTWQAAPAGGAITELWKFRATSDQTIGDTWTDVTGASVTKTFSGGTVLFLVSVSFEAVPNKPVRVGQFRLSISTQTTTYVPDTTGFYFTSPYNLDEVGTACNVFVLTSAPTGSYTVKLQARMNTSEQCKIGQDNYLSSVMVKL